MGRLNTDSDQLLHDDADYRVAKTFTAAHRIDIVWFTGPTLVLYAADGTKHSYPLTPAEAFALVRRLTGYLAHLYTTSAPQEHSDGS